MSLTGTRGCIAASRCALQGRPSVIAASRCALEGRPCVIAASRCAPKGRRIGPSLWQRLCWLAAARGCSQDARRTVVA
ncbi:hypothetical protein ACFPRL_13920 [Pseudoclavibacter helvolus]